MFKFISSGLIALALSMPALAQQYPPPVNDPYPYEGQVSTPLPRPTIMRDADGYARLIPFFGAGASASDGVESFDGQSTSWGLWFDMGNGPVTFQTGFSFDNHDVELPSGLGEASFDTWGIPLMMKFNLSGNPQETFFLKAGFNFVDETNEFLDYIDTMGVLGLGVALPADNKRMAFLIEADYSNLLSRESFEQDLESFKVFGGLAFRMY